jgi:hypothetical protein
VFASSPLRVPFLLIIELQGLPFGADAAMQAAPYEQPKATPMTLTRKSPAGGATIRRPLQVAAAALSLFLLAACGKAAATNDAAKPPDQHRADVAAAISPTVLRPGQPIPKPKGEPVLALLGKIGAVNDGRALRFDTSTLEQLGLVKVTVYEPWVKKNLDFQGVWLADVLKLAQTTPDARGIHLTAMDDYQVDLSMGDIQTGRVLLATKAGDGSPLPIEAGGPTRIVFVQGNGVSADQWIWSLKDIDVR